MGADRGEATLIEGALRYLAENGSKKVEIVLVGDEAQLRGPLDKLKTKLKDRNPAISIQHAPEIVEMSAAATEGIRRKNSSIAIAMRMHKEERTQAVVSAGNTGAVMANAVLTLGRIPGVSRPAIAGTFPNKLEGISILLDVGANVDIKPENILQFAQMGASYAEGVLKCKNPRVGLLSIGEERSKGNELILAAHELLRKGRFNFLGNVEGRDILDGSTDVIVCDGFVGNILLKFAESMKTFLETRIKKQISSNIFSRTGAILMGPFLRRIRQSFDYAEYGGAPLLGIAGTCIIAHGASSARAIASAIRVAAEMVASDVNGGILKRIENYRRAAAEQ
jgi:glycerol-3-phosphate acyltransferase PlsX